MSKTKSTPIQVSNPYKFSVYKTGDTNLNNAWVKVALDTELFDTNNNFDSATNYRYVAPVAGFYQINAQVAVASAGLLSSACAEAAIYKNGAVLAYLGPRLIGSGSSTQMPRMGASFLLQLAANDYLELYGFCSESRNIVGGAERTFMSGYLVSTT